MKEEKIIDAIGYIDDNLIKETQRIRNKKKFPHKITGLIAACFILCIICTAIVSTALERNSKYVGTDIRPGASDLISGNSSYVTDDGEKSDEETVQINESCDTDDNCINENVKLPESDCTVATIPLYITVNSICENKIEGTVADNLGNDSFVGGSKIIVYIADNTSLPVFPVSTGDTVYVEYIKKDESGKAVIYASKIYFEISDTTPSLY